jgi:hypothetical protein
MKFIALTMPPPVGRIIELFNEKHDKKALWGEAAVRFV